MLTPLAGQLPRLLYGAAFPPLGSGSQVASSSSGRPPPLPHCVFVCHRSWLLFPRGLRPLGTGVSASGLPPCKSWARAVRGPHRPFTNERPGGEGPAACQPPSSPARLWLQLALHFTSRAFLRAVGEHGKALLFALCISCPRNWQNNEGGKGAGRRVPRALPFSSFGTWRLYLAVQVPVSFPLPPRGAPQGANSSWLPLGPSCSKNSRCSGKCPREQRKGWKRKT